MNIADLIDLIARVPAAFWSGIGGAAFTIFGVLIANAGSKRRLKMQLERDAEEKLRDRQSTLRREVYLNAAEALVELASFLPTLPDVDVTKTNSALAMKGFQIAVAKLQMVAEEATVSEVTTLAHRYNELFLRLTLRIVPLRSVQADIKICDEHYEQSQSEIKRILAAMTQYNEAARSDQHVFDALQRSIDYHMKRSDELSSEQAALGKQRTALHLDFLRYVLDRLDKIAPQQNRVLIEVRREIGLAGNLDAFAMQLEQQRQMLKALVEEVFQQAEKLQQQDEDAAPDALAV